ncbi:MAG: ABC transporter permease [Sphingomonas bacterium]|nr:ABC transporter permease [Sphingomonas bacterium]
MSGWQLAWTIGRRELDWRFRGLRLLFFSLLLGVAALAAVGSLAAAMERGLADRGSVILGGDVEFARSARLATTEERAAFAAAGRVSESIRMTSTAVIGERSIPVQLKAVDDAYPMVGALRLADGRTTGAPPSGQAWIDPALAGRVPLGSSFRLGTATFRVGGVIADEPDRLGEGFSLGPVVMVGLRDLPATGLMQPGSLFEIRYRIVTAANPRSLIDRTIGAFPAGGWESKTRDNAAPGAGRFFSRMAEFLTLIVLTALVIAGIGIANAVASFLQARQSTIATLKVLGADSGLVRRIYALQLALVAGLATIAGLGIGMLAVAVVSRVAAGVLPLALDTRPAWGPMSLAAGFGLLTAFAAAALPLARAATVPVAGLLRGSVDSGRASLARGLPWLAVPSFLILALALGSASRPLLTAYYLGAVAAVLALLAGLGWLVRWGAAKVPRPASPFLRLALAGLHRPGAGTIGLVVALGIGLTMFVQIAGVRSSFDANLERNIPERAPAFFALDVPRDRADEFRATVRATSPSAEVELVPLLRGVVTGYGTTNVANLAEIPDGAWALRGERGLTYAETLPPGSSLTEGKWWPKDYRGEPLVSVDDRLGEALGLKLGDELRFSIFGVERRARIASFRRIDWDTLGFNFVLVLSPNALADVPHNLSATIGLPDGADAAVRERVAARFPSTSLVPVRDVLEQVGEVAAGVSVAIAWAASAAILAGIAVLAGTTSAMRDARTYDGVVLRVLGATRRQLLRLQVLEFLLLATLVTLVALGLGLFGAWLIITLLFDFVWAPDPWLVAGTVAAGLTVVLLVGLAGSLPTLSARPSRALRTL